MEGVARTNARWVFITSSMDAWPHILSVGVHKMATAQKGVFWSRGYKDVISFKTYYTAGHQIS